MNELYTIYVDAVDTITLIALFDRLGMKYELLRVLGGYRLFRATLTEDELVIVKLATTPVYIYISNPGWPEGHSINEIIRIS